MVRVVSGVAEASLWCVAANSPGYQKIAVLAIFLWAELRIQLFKSPGSRNFAWLYSLAPVGAVPTKTGRGPVSLI